MMLQYPRHVKMEKHDIALRSLITKYRAHEKDSIYLRCR
jgi:hypothetical protein